MKYDYYKIEIPSDCETNKEARFNLAILEAKDRTRLYVIPCTWKLISDNGEIIKICRIRN